MNNENYILENKIWKFVTLLSFQGKISESICLRKVKVMVLVIIF